MPDQTVHLVDYDPSWPQRFAEQRARVAVLLAPWLAGEIEHVGSTAVPGMTAKPVIDMLAPTTPLNEAERLVQPLEADGWLFWPDDPNRDWRRWFLRPSPERRTHHLHVIEHNHPQAQAMVAFRDALRADPRLRSEYQQTKARLAWVHRGNRNAYTNAKSDFIRQALRELGLDTPEPERLPD